MEQQCSRFPKRITIELTNRCNVECTFCPRHLVNMNLGFMEESLFQKVVDEATQYLPVCMVIFLRGESLLHPKALDMIAYAKNKGIAPIQLATNGLILDDCLADKLLESGLDFISFSMDTEDEQLYNRCRKYGDFQTSRNNILSFLKKCKQRKVQGKSAPETQLSTITTPEYLPGKQAFVDFWTPYADIVRVYQQHSADGNLGSLNGVSHDQKRIPCNKLSTDMVVYWDGTVALCNHDWNTKAGIGNVCEHTVAELWTGVRYQQLRRMHEECRFESELVCKECDHWRMYDNEAGFVGEKYQGTEKT